jgi:hypothetical protein
VPALRGNPAGNLVNGQFPNPTGNGETDLITTGGEAPTHGDLTGDNVPDAAAVIGATSGHGGGDEYVELYTNRDQRLGEFDPATATAMGHAMVLAMVIRNGEVLIDWAASSVNDPAGPKNAFWSAHVRWDGHQVVVTNQVPHTGATGSGLWADQTLTITTTSMGAVKVGMTVNQAEPAAGVRFDGSGDGFTYPTTLPPGYPHLYLGHGCVGAAATAPSPQTVSTPEGIRLGDTLTKLKSTYGPSLRYVPSPGVGMSPTDGYIVPVTGGNLVFVLDSTGNTIVRITGGGTDLTPSACGG